MKYTESRDGIKRCTVRLEMRFTKKEFQDILKVARMVDCSTVKEYLSSTLLDGERLYECMQDDIRLFGKED